MSIGRTELEYVTRADERSIDFRGAAVEVNGTDMVGGLVAGLAYGQPRIITGIVMGPARIIVDRRDERPGETVENWEDVVEVSLQAADDDIVAAGPYADAPDGSFAFNPPGAKWFRLRVHGRNRDLEYDLVASGPHEEYLLMTWPEAPSVPSVISVGSECARQLNTTRTPSSPSAAAVAVTNPRPARSGDWSTDSPEDERRRAQAVKNLLRIAQQNKER